MLLFLLHSVILERKTLNLFYVSVLCLANISTSRIVKRNTGVEVRNGRNVEVHKNVLSFNVEPTQVCKVEVVTNEPMHQRVGVFKPEVFDCDYLPGALKYSHNGSPFLGEDTVKMRAYILHKNFTEQETLFLRVSILNSRCDVIQINRIPIVVPNLQQKSNTITRDVVDFDYDRVHDTLCNVRIPQDDFPRYGRILEPSNTSLARRPELVEVGSEFDKSCEEFVVTGLRYEHLTPPTPDMDYIPLHVVVSDRRSGSFLLEEKHWLPVQIEGAFPNQAPKSSFSNMYILEVDQFVLTNLLPMTVSATDGETSNDKLVFNITRSPRLGFITHLHDQSKPINSFTQQDLQELQIAYQPPNISFTERQNFEVEFVVYDEYFAQSKPIRAIFSVRVAHTNAPRVSWNKGITMLEGQSRVIDNNILQVVDKDNLDEVRFTLAGGLRHGRLHVGDRPGYSFRWRDVQEGRVLYKHDDTDTRKDFIVFRITDRFHSVRFKLPITILPKDDAPPFLINNIVFTVEEGQAILIHRFMLKASDADSAADYITFNITVPPEAGEIQKRRKWERSGWRVDTFQQSDLYQGLIYYKHLGNEKFQDSFQFTLSDINRPTPNQSPEHTVEIKITPVDDLLPEPGEGNSLALTVNETDVIHITNEELHYVDVEQGNLDVAFTLTTDLFRLDGSGVDAGKLIFTDDMVMLMKDPSVPVLRTFTQSAVNHNKVAYMPPIRDIGPHPVDVQFTFTVIDDGGNELTGQTFAITILPVDNQPPSIKFTELCLNEGSSEILAADVIQLGDRDTDIAYLKIILTSLPIAGSLRKDNVKLGKEDSFSYADVEQFRVTYVHNGSEVHRDSFELTVSDGKQNASAVMNVRMEPIDDELPVITGGNSSLHVPEGGQVLLNGDFLSATDADTDDNRLIFEVLTPPRLGAFTIEGEEVVTFLQNDVTNSRVYYTHSGSEVGKTPIKDLAIVMVSDRKGHPIDVDGDSVQTKDLYFTVLPVNSRTPRLALGHRVFRCDEGESEVLSHHYVMADDEDTESENLVYIVESLPTYGYIENITPRPGYESVAGFNTTSFTHHQLMNGHIRYKQSEHKGIEPTADQFAVAVSDGQFKSVSVPFLVSITPTNDEEPIVRVENMTCNEGFMKEISIDVEDLDMPKDEVMISVVKEPDHGMIMNEMEMLLRHKRSAHGRRHNYPAFDEAMHHMEPMNEFSLHQLKASTVIPAYVHDGSEEDFDTFEMKITDGKHTSKKLLNVKVMPVNDEQPEVVINKGITLEFGEAKVISGVALQATDGDNANSELIYELHSVPRRGNLQIRTDGTNWVNLDYTDSFTEEDVEMNRIRYKHTSVLGSKGKDSFRFSVSDGEFISQRENFQITIENTKKDAVHVLTHPLRVNEKEKVFLTADVLTARDSSGRPHEISYDVIRNPIYGRIEYVAFPDVEIEMFTQLDLLAGSVVYVHTSKEDSPVDTFRVSASNGVKSREAEVSVLITSIDSELPVLVSRKNETPSTDPPHVSLVKGSSVAISEMIITIEDQDSPKRKYLSRKDDRTKGDKKNLHLALVTLPDHGTLTLLGVSVDENSQISQEDLENSNFFYQHSGDSSQIDRFSFVVSDSVHTGYMFNGELQVEPTVFYLKIESVDETPPLIRTNRRPTLIEKIGNGRLYGISLDYRVLEAVDEESDDPADITFTIASPPSFGILTLRSNNDFRTPTLRFTQRDLNQRDVIYVIASKLDVTNDNFTFDVEDSWGNTLREQRFKMAWPRVEMTKKKSKVCEHVGSVPVRVRRYGSAVSSSFVSVSVQRGTATPGVDFVASSADQIQFDPGSLTESWAVVIINDSLEERKEKIKIQLHFPVNCVLVPRKTLSTIIILDNSHRSCRKKQTATKSRKKKTILRDSTNVLKTEDSIRYGKLPPGATVSPQSFFRNKTIRLWRYHALLPVTTGEESTSRREASNHSEMLSNSVQSRNGIVESDELNDDPTIVESGNREHSRTLEVENSDVSAVVTVRGRNQAVQALPSSVRQSCILDKTGALFFDSSARILYRCDGASWVRWKKPKSRSKAGSDSPALPCRKNWKSFANRCFLVGATDAISWNSAQRSCREEHSAHLVTVTNKKHLKWLQKLVNRSRFWIGLNRKMDPELWEWTDGRGVIFTNWKRGYPASQLNECAMVGARGRWIDSSCSQRHSDVKYVCEKLP